MEISQVEYIRMIRIQIGKKYWDWETCRKGILLPKLFWPPGRKKCSSSDEKLLKCKAEGREFSKFLRSLEQSIQTLKG